MKKQKIKAISIEWIDSSCFNGWREKWILDKNTAKCFSYGIYVKEDKNFITIAHSVNVDGIYCDQLSIPKVAIIKKRIYRI